MNYEVKFIGHKNIYKVILYNGYFHRAGIIYFSHESAAENYLKNNNSTFMGKIELQVHTVIEFVNGNMYVLGESVNIS